MKPHPVSLQGSAVTGSQPRDPASRTIRALRIIHPFPTLLNVAATIALACVAVRGFPDAALLTRMAGMMFCAQAAIGVTNDIFDRDLDAQTKPWKPLPAGVVSPASALILAVALIAATIALAATLGAAGFALGLLGTACGLVYDVWLKRTAWSAVPFMVAIPTLPLWVWATLDRWQPELWWLILLGPPIGLAVHLANTAPDIDDDVTHGVRGLAHRLGLERSMRLAWASFAAALALSLALASVLSYDLRWYVPTLAIGVACIAASMIVRALGRDTVASPLGFGVISAGGAIVAVGWLASIT